MARLPPSRHPLHCGLRIPDLRARDDSPLNRSCHQGVPAICLMRRLPAQSIRRCGLNATFRTRLQQCDGDWWPLSPRCYRVAHAARLGTDTEICDTVRLGARVVSIPAQLIADADGRVPHDTIMAMNDDLAALVARYPGRIHGQASVDAYDGDRAAREAERAIRELGLRSLFVECAFGDLLINAPQARPTLEVAAKLGVPVFVHPVAPQPLTRQMVPYGLIGTLIARGTVNSAALIALVEGEVFSQLPGLRVVVTAHAIGGLAMLAGLSGQSRLSGGAIEVLRRNVFVDT